MKLFVFGLGYTAASFIRTALPWTSVGGTVRSTDKASALRQEGIEAIALDTHAEDEISRALSQADALLVSAPPADAGDPHLIRFRDAVAAAGRLAWIGYLSTTGVYGDRGGAWTDETAPVQPQSAASRRRIAAEREWLDLLRSDAARPVHIFRLSGIYGPERNALVNLGRGTAQRIVKPGQVFNRIHVDDIAQVLAASVRHPRPGAIYNLSDDEPAPPQDVVTYAASLAGIAPPPELPFDAAELSPMARSFYSENKRIANRLVKDELGVRLRFPTYREGLDALYAAGEFAQVA